ncbi:BgTH12-06089 [Blumeria graminis f. sp. triticale]|uniref:BgTH12-06089 n=1 Tax=Blumeria graminis f. sp. triticale TaxID=1689686 RepID=A0A9W4D556_BLUGR|nr:BgTH12-06089 [Blumeria graminis f. sp. triticale]
MLLKISTSLYEPSEFKSETSPHASTFKPKDVDPGTSKNVAATQSPRPSVLEIEQQTDTPIEQPLTEVEKFVKEAWPEALLDRDIDDKSFTNVKNKVIIKAEWRLVKADIHVFEKLNEIQSALRVALVPYCIWTERLAHEMSSDFKGICVWANERRNLKWIELLHAIFKNMELHDCLHSSLTVFAGISPDKGDSIYSFAWRLRSAFYGLSQTDRVSRTTRTMITDLCSKYLPRVWTLGEPSLDRLRNSQRVEKVVQIAERVCKWSSEDKHFVKTSETYLSSMDVATSQNDLNLYPAIEYPPDSVYVNHCDVCFHCQKEGHWANNFPNKHRYHQNFGRHTIERIDNTHRIGNTHRNPNPSKGNSRVLVPQSPKHLLHQLTLNNRTYLVNSDELYKDHQVNPSQIGCLDPGQNDDEIDLDNLINDMDREYPEKQ